MVELTGVLRPHHGLTAAILTVGLLTAGCAARVSSIAATSRPPVAVAPAVAPADPAPQPVSDPVADLIAESSRYFEVTALAQGDGFSEQKDAPASIDDPLAVSTFDKPDATPETGQAVVEDPISLDIDIPLNTRVVSFVGLFTGRLRDYLQDGLSRGVRFLPMIQDVFRAEGLPLDLAYVPLVESAFKPNALSRAKAKGMWQFMRGTALENGLKHDWYIDERVEPEKATRAAAKYLKSLYATFGDWNLALASYNAGPGRVQGAIRRSGGVKDFWRLSASRRYLPRETRDYVPLILAAVIIARNPAQYGVDIEPPPVATPGFETVTLPAAVDLRRVAEWAGTSIQTIQDLNPELRRWTTPARGKDYELKVPEGAGELVRARVADAGPDAAALNWHTVRKGETLLTISRKLKVSRADLADANYLSVRSRVTPGQQLIIPRAPTLLLATHADNPAPLAESRPVDAVVATRATVPEAKPPVKLIYRVKRGDTLASIARVFQTSVASLRKWNGIKGTAIRAGERLTIFTTTRVVSTR